MDAQEEISKAFNEREQWASEVYLAKRHLEKVEAELDMAIRKYKQVCNKHSALDELCPNCDEHVTQYPCNNCGRSYI